MLTPEERAQRMKDIMRDRAARRRLVNNLVPGLPVDGAPPETRRRADRMGDALDDVVDALLAVPNTFYDNVVSKWSELFPGTPARPSRFEEDAHAFKLFLAVPNAGAAFALRAQMPRIRRTLKALDGAPKKKITLIVKIG